MGNSPSLSYADRELTTACTKGNLGRVKLLVERDGAEVDKKDEFGWTGLMHAISEGHLDVVKYLIAKGALTTAVTPDGAGALHHAVASQNDSLLAFLLQYNTCNVNATSEGGWTPLHLASLSNQLTSVKLLLAGKADKSLKTGEGKTAADVATAPQVKSFIKEYELLPLSEALRIPEDTEVRPQRMQESLQALQTMKNPPRAVEMKGGYSYLLGEDAGSNDDLLTVTTTSNYGDNQASNSAAAVISNNNNDTAADRGKERSIGSSGDVPKDLAGAEAKERELQRIFAAIQVLRNINTEKLNMIQVQELIEFHRTELNKYTEAKLIMDQIREKELDLLLAD